MNWQVRRARVSDMEAAAEIINEHIAMGWAHFGDLSLIHISEPTRLQ